MTPLARVLSLRLAVSQSAVSKYRALLDRQYEGRVHDSFVYCGAARTKRWSARGLQFQNMKSPPKGSDPAKVAEQLLDGSLPDLGVEGMAVLGGAVRASVAAGEGRALVVRDLVAIEPRGLGWLTGDPELNAIFREDKDPYKAFAVHWAGVPYDRVNAILRKQSKAPFLGCGYGLGAKTLITYAKGEDVTLTTDQAQTAIDTYRRIYRRGVTFWYWVEHAMRVAALGGREEGYGLVLAREGQMVTIQLPSKGKLYYKDARVEDGSLVYTGMDNYTHVWGTVRTWGSRLTENIVQAIARDVLAHAMHLAKEADFPLVFHLHDELGAEVALSRVEAAGEFLDWCMTQVPPWAKGLLLAASGYEANRMRKD